MTVLIRIELDTNFCGGEETIYYEVEEDLLNDAIDYIVDEMAYLNAEELGLFGSMYEDDEIEYFGSWEEADETREEIEEMGYEIHKL